MQFDLPVFLDLFWLSVKLLSFLLIVSIPYKKFGYGIDTELIRNRYVLGNSVSQFRIFCRDLHFVIFFKKI